MEPLSMNKRALKWIYLYPAEKNAGKWNKFNGVICLAVVIISQVIGLIFSSFHFFKYCSIDLERALYGVFQIASLIDCIYTVFILLSQRRQIYVMFGNLTKIYTASNWIIYFLVRLFWSHWEKKTVFILILRCEWRLISIFGSCNQQK